MDYGQKFTLDVIDNSMSPKLFEGDCVTVLERAEVEENRFMAVLVTDDATRISTLYVRKVAVESDRITLIPCNPAFPTQVFEGEKMQNVRVVGVLTHLHRFLDDDAPSYGEMTRRGNCNRAALEKSIGSIKYD